MKRPSVDKPARLQKVTHFRTALRYSPLQHEGFRQTKRYRVRAIEESLMQSEEQRLIDGLFSRLQQAETQSAPRDANAERIIAQHVQAQPAAPYSWRKPC